MTRKSSISNTKMNNESASAIDPLSKTEVGFVPLFNTKQPVEKDEQGLPIKGLGLLIYQGFVISPIIWVNDKGQEQFRNAKKHVFAVKSSDLSWKCIDVTIGKYNPGNLCDRFLKAMNVSDFMKVINDEDEDGWSEGETFDDSAVDAQLTELRGLTYTASLERVEGKSGIKVYRIQIETLQPLLDASGTHKRRQEVTATDPHAKTIFSQSDDN